MTAARMLAEAVADLGMSGRPNAITRDYASRHGEEFLHAPWCDMGVTHWARQSGNSEAVLPRGDRAYTVWHAEDGERLGLWYAGTADNIRRFAKPGAPVFFDWGGTNSIGTIDHVGIVEVNLGDGRVQTIEANTGDAVKRRVRGAADIAGFWNPAYDGGPTKPAAPALEDLVNKLPMLKKGADNFDVKTIRGCLFARGGLAPAAHGGPARLQEWLERTDFDAALDSDVRAFQREKKLEVDGIVYTQTWQALLRL